MQVHVVIDRRSEAVQKGDGAESRASRARPVTGDGLSRHSRKGNAGKQTEAVGCAHAAKGTGLHPIDRTSPVKRVLKCR
jgi:hypothetical protein